MVLGAFFSSPRLASAGGVAVESVAGARDKAVAQVLAPIFAELARRGYRNGYKEVGKAFEAAGSRPSQVLTATQLADLPERVDQAYRLWITGKFEEGRAALRPLIEEAHRNPAAAISNLKVGPAVFKALVGLAMCNHRLGDDTGAWAAMAELVRSFDVEVTKAQFGVEAFTLFQQVRKEARSSSSGSLVVRAASPTAAIYINERFAKIGEISRTDLVPGTYRVIAQLGPDFGRAYDVEVKPGGKAELVVDPEFERAVMTGPEWTGLAFHDRADRERREVEVASRLGGALGELGVIVVGVDLRKERNVAYGALINASTGKEIRRASVVIDTLPPPARLQSLARFLIGERTPLEGVEVHQIVERPRPQPGASITSAPPPPPPPFFTTRRKISAGLGFLGIGSAVAGVVMHSQALSFQDQADAICEKEPDGMASCSPGQNEKAQALNDKAVTRFHYAIAAYSVGGVALIAATYLWLTGAPAAADPEGTALAPHLTPSVAPGYAGFELTGRF
jgi:hypothetical protein